MSNETPAPEGAKSRPVGVHDAEISDEIAGFHTQQAAAPSRSACSVVAGWMRPGCERTRTGQRHFNFCAMPCSQFAGLAISRLPMPRWPQTST